MTDYVTNVSAVQESLFENSVRDLSAHGECYEPHANSAAAQFLLGLLDEAAELLAYADADELRQVVDAGSVLDYSGAVHERADAAVPTYTRQVWSVFSDLGAFTEDPTELGFNGSDMEQGAKVCLYMIAERVLHGLLSEAGERLVVVDADEVKRLAAELGAEHGEDAASSAADDLFGGRSTGKVAMRAAIVLEAIKDGDPRLDEFMPRPDLSGEWADSFTVERLADELSIPYGSDDDAELFVELLNEAADEYERAYRDAAEDELARQARQAMD